MGEIMKKVFLLLLVFGAGLVLTAQELEKVIYLPDSLGGLITADRMAVVPATGEVYVGGSHGNCVIVFDGLTGEKRARIPMSGGVARMCYVPQETTVYCASFLLDSLYVIDARSRTVVHRLGTGLPMGHLSYNCVRNKIYLSDSGSARLVVVDCGQNRVIADVPLGGSGGATVFSRCFDKIYSFVRKNDGNQILIIECSDDQIVDSILLGDIEMEQMLYNPVVKKIYATGETGDVTIIDCWTNRVLRHWVSQDRPWVLCLNLERNKVYLAESGGDALVKVISGVDDSVIKVIYGEDEGAHSLAYDPNRDRVYALDLSAPLWAIDCATDSVAGVLRYEYGESLYFSPELDRIYTAQSDVSEWVNDVAIVNPDSLTITARVPLYFYQSDLKYASGVDKLYCCGRVAVSGENRLIVIDGIDNKITATLTLPEAWRVCYSPVNRKVFVSGDTLMMVVNCVNDSVERVISLPDPAFDVFYNPVVNKIYHYSSAANNVLVFDCARESVVARIPVYATGFEGFSFNPRQRRTYLSTRDTFWLIDSDADTVVKKIPGDFGTNWCYINGRDWVVVGQGFTIRAIGGTSDTVDTVVNLTHTVDGMAYNPRTDKLYITSEAGGMIFIYEGRRLGRLGFFPVPARPSRLQMDTLNGLLYCKHRDGVTLIDGRTDSIIITVPAPSQKWSPVLNPNYPRFYVSDSAKTGIAVWRRPAIGVEEKTPDRIVSRSIPTVVRGLLVLPEIKSNGSGRAVALFDITGRKIFDLMPGLNDVRMVPAGVYFIYQQDQGAGNRNLGRVIIQH